LNEFGEIAAQKWKIEIGRDPVAIRQPKLEELFDRAARHDDRSSSEGIAKLILVHEATDRIDQRFEAIRVVEMNHRDGSGRIVTRLFGSNQREPLLARKKLHN